MTAAARPRRIVVVGSTHGNEKSGYWAVRAIQENPALFARPGISVEALAANPDAEARNLRYLDVDLNRCFGPELRIPPDCRERRRAREIRDALGTPDLVIDVHNTTGAMGVSWILTAPDPWVWWLASEMLPRDPRTRILYTPETRDSNVFLPSLGRSEITLEIGPVPHGTHSHWAAQAAIDQIRATLDLVASVGDDFDPVQALRSTQFDYFFGQPSVDYPRDASGRIRATIHQSFAGSDYRPLEDGAPVFFDPVRGETIAHSGPVVHPVFVGEAAYVEKGIAFTPTLLRRWNGGREVLA